MVWDLHPNVDIPSAPLSPSPPSHRARSNDSQTGGSGNARPQPTAYVISFPHALSSVCAHATTTKGLLVADVRGSRSSTGAPTLRTPAPTRRGTTRASSSLPPRAQSQAARARSRQHANPDVDVTSSPPLLSLPLTLIFNLALIEHIRPYNRRFFLLIVGVQYRCRTPLPVLTVGPLQATRRQTDARRCIVPQGRGSFPMVPDLSEFMVLDFIQPDYCIHFPLGCNCGITGIIARRGVPTYISDSIFQNGINDRSPLYYA